MDASSSIKTANESWANETRTQYSNYLGLGLSILKFSFHFMGLGNCTNSLCKGLRCVTVDVVSHARRSDKMIYLLCSVVIDRIRSFAIKRFGDCFSLQAVVHS